jgi:hypothetical protein
VLVSTGDLVDASDAFLDDWLVPLRDLVPGFGKYAILGNHDLHLLARAAGWADARPEDRLDEVLAADDRETLLEWLRRRPFIHRAGSALLVHAGLLPEWSGDEALSLAGSAGRRLQALTRESMQLNASMSTVMTERFNVAGAMLVKLYGRYDTEERAFDQRAAQVRDTGIRSAMYGRAFFVGLGVVAAEKMKIVNV